MASQARLRCLPIANVLVARPKGHNPHPQWALATSNMRACRVSPCRRTHVVDHPPHHVSSCAPLFLSFVTAHWALTNRRLIYLRSTQRSQRQPQTRPVLGALILARTLRRAAGPIPARDAPAASCVLPCLVRRQRGQHGAMLAIAAPIAKASRAGAALCGSRTAPSEGCPVFAFGSIYKGSRTNLLDTSTGGLTQR